MCLIEELLVLCARSSPNWEENSLCPVGQIECFLRSDADWGLIAFSCEPPAFNKKVSGPSHVITTAVHFFFHEMIYLHNSVGCWEDSKRRLGFYQPKNILLTFSNASEIDCVTSRRVNKLCQDREKRGKGIRPRGTHIFCLCVRAQVCNSIQLRDAHNVGNWEACCWIPWLIQFHLMNASSIWICQ